MADLVACDAAVPADAYQQRAANNPVPFHVPPEHRDTLTLHTPQQGRALAAAGQSYWADTSEYQSPYTPAYPYPVASFRFHTGWRLDNVATANWAHHQAAIITGQTRIVIAYAVFVPGQLPRVLADMYSLFGDQYPTTRLVLMIDMESGNGFAGPGDHSAEANQWAQAFADYTGTSDTWARSIGYANHGDWHGNWPGVDPRLKDITAAYDGADPTPWAWQYAGGNPAYPAPPGAPRNAAPWTDIYIDMNLAHHTIDELEQQFGITGGDDMDIVVDDVRGGSWWITAGRRVGIDNPAVVADLVAAGAKHFTGWDPNQIDAVPIAGLPTPGESEILAALVALTAAVKAIPGGSTTFTFPTYSATFTPEAS